MKNLERGTGQSGAFRRAVLHPRVFSHSNAWPMQFKTRLGATVGPALTGKNTSLISCSIWTREDEEQEGEEGQEGEEREKRAGPPGK